MGRPTKFTKKLAEDICLKLAQGQSLRSICAAKRMPDISTVLRWYLSESDVYKGFREQYERARVAQRHLYEDENVDIADDASNDWMDRHVGKDETIRVLDHEHVQRSKLRIDTRKWIIERMVSKRPKEEGDGDQPPEAEQVVFVRGPDRKSKAGDGS